MKKLQEVMFEEDEKMTTFSIEDPLTGNIIVIPMKNELLLSLSPEKLIKIISTIIEKEFKKEQTIQGVITKPIVESVEMIVSEEDMDIIKKCFLNK
jgi:hypothetical protein